MGEYAVAHVDVDTTITALADPDGIQNLFYIDTYDTFAVSTRPVLLAILAGKPEIDYHSLAWISAIGYRVGGSTAYRHVKAIPQGTALIWNGRKVFRNRRTALHRDHAEGIVARPKWFEEHLERAIAAAGVAVQLVSRNKNEIELAITGGKDSRMVLALCLAAGLKDRLALYTNGPPDHPDVVVGKLIADKIGVPHRENAPRPVAATYQEADVYLGRPVLVRLSG